MTQTLSENVFILSRDAARFYDDIYQDAWLIKFNNSNNITFALEREFNTLELPDTISFDAIFETLDQTDYPTTDCGWPIMSQRMIDSLLKLGDFPHRKIPVQMKSCKVTGHDKKNKKYITSDEVREDFFIVQLLEHLEIFNWEESVYERHPRMENRVKNVEKLVLDQSPNGLPPIFRLSVRPPYLLITDQAYETLKADGIKGITVRDPRLL